MLEVEGTLQIITWVITNNGYNQVIDVWIPANAQLTELAMKTLEKTNKVSTRTCLILEQGFQRTNLSVNWYAWFDEA
jgi:hypothetical protein